MNFQNNENTLISIENSMRNDLENLKLIKKDINSSYDNIVQKFDEGYIQNVLNDYQDSLK